MNHTPGPWTSYPCNLEAYSQVITAKGCMVQIANTGVRGHVAMTKEVYGDRMTYGPCEETMANARLIAAAPDLISELKNLRRAYVNLLESGRDRILLLGGQCDDVATMEAADPNLRKTDAAIKKADGQS